MHPFAYLDNAATARPDPDAIAEAKAFLDRDFGNPSSAHALGLEAERAVRAARRRVAAALGAGGEAEVVFTGGGTEANNLAIRGTLAARRRDGDHVVTSAVEHPSVLETCRDLERRGAARVSYVDPRPDGTLCPDAVAAAVTDRTVLVSVMHVQNETGALFDVAAIAARCKRAREGVTVHVDGVQAFGKLALRVASETAIDLYTVSGHKIGAPKGVGALWRRPRTRIAPLITGGGQEDGLRSGTENVFGIVALGAAAAGASADRAAFAARARALGERLRAGIAALDDAAINSPPGDAGAPWIVNASFAGAKGEVLLHALEQRGVFVSTTAACASRKGKKSHVLAAMGIAEARIDSALRFSLGRTSTEADVDLALEALVEALPRVRTAGRAGGRGSGGAGRRGRAGVRR